ncbi:MAG TPA: hypothetical protein VGM20_05985 [Gemmatimonadales bacterium]|jgi:hypothetical protein
MIPPRSVPRSAVVLLVAAAMPLAGQTQPRTQAQAPAQLDACTLVTVAQVSAAAGKTVGQGTHVTPTFVKTCTWTAQGTVVTLNTQPATFFDGAKGMATQVAAAAKGNSMSSAGVGDDSYFLIQGTQVMLMVKKGANAFKATVYDAAMSVDAKKGVELALAKAALGKI